jgi:hypothetical protein
MISATVLAVLFVPVFFLVVRSIFKGKVAAPHATMFNSVEKEH